MMRQRHLGAASATTTICLFLVLLSSSSHAFSASTGSCHQQRTGSSSSLGPVARNGLEYQDVTIGTGRRVLPGDTVFCYYTGSFKKKQANNFFGGEATTVFDEIVDGDPFAFPVGKGEVILGWELGVLGKLDLEIPPMNIGGKRKLVIPSGLAYGEEGNGPIPANQDLLFDIEVLNSEPLGGISLEYRLKGYAVAVSIPLVILTIVWLALNSLQL